MMFFMILNAVLTALCLLGTWYNAKQIVWGFWIWILTNTVYALIDIFLYQNYFRALLFIIQTGMCIMGVTKWSKLEEERKNAVK
jgi:nicotinamide mononucleotide transporter